MLIGIILVCRCTTSCSLACQAYHRWLRGQKAHTHCGCHNSATTRPINSKSVYLNRLDLWMCNLILNCSPMAKKEAMVLAYAKVSNLQANSLQIKFTGIILAHRCATPWSLHQGQPMGQMISSHSFADAVMQQPPGLPNQVYCNHLGL